MDADGVEAVRTLFREYAGSLGVDRSFQGHNPVAGTRFMALRL